MLNLSDELREALTLKAARMELLKKQIELEEREIQLALKRELGIDPAQDWTVDLVKGVVEHAPTPAAAK